MPLRIFLGYGGRQAEDMASRLKEFLKEQGWEVFKAPEDVPIGPWQERTIPALKKADVFIVVFARGSWKSQELWKEIIIAKEYNIEIYPIVAGNVNTQNLKFPTILNDYKMTKFDSGIDAVFGEIRNMLEEYERQVPYHRLEVVEETPE